MVFTHRPQVRDSTLCEMTRGSTVSGLWLMRRQAAPAG